MGGGGGGEMRGEMEEGKHKVLTFAFFSKNRYAFLFDEEEKNSNMSSIYTIPSQLTCKKVDKSLQLISCAKIPTFSWEL